VRLGGIAKGSGMIHPNMGTMLCFLTTDCAVSAPMIKKLCWRRQPSASTGYP
jgi:glutamate N-acetyltransferase/amino-acid N-acetyltransferase